MAETISSRGREIVVKGFNPQFIVERTINGSDIYPGRFVTNVSEANNSDVDLCESGEGPLGVALEHYLDDGLAGTVRDTPDIDAVYTDNATVRVALCGSGMVVLCFLGEQTATAAVYGGSRLFMTTTGKLKLADAITFSTTTAQLGVDVTALLAELKSLAGICQEYDAGGSTDKVITVMI